MSQETTTKGTVASPNKDDSNESKSLKDISPRQWKSGIAAWLGWLFDGLDMHLYTLVAAPFVASLLVIANTGDQAVKEKSSWIQAAFMVGWALGGAFFGRIGDKIGRSKALSLTILTYALFTGLSFFVTSWWQLLICRFLTALGIGGEWAVGASLLSETWPKKWRPWLAAVLQTGVNLGVLLACAAVFLLADHPPKYVFLIGVLPAFLVFWIRKHVPEPDEWKEAKAKATVHPGVADLFKGAIRSTTLRVIAVCAFSLTGWWAFMFWHPQYLRSLPEVLKWTEAERQKLVSTTFFLVISASIFGNFFAGWMASRFGYRKSIQWMLISFVTSILLAFSGERDYRSLLFWLSLVGFSSGVFGLFTMYLPPLFPTLIRTTGAGFCYNIGRIAAGIGIAVFAFFLKVTDLRTVLLIDGALFFVAFLFAFLLPELSTEEGGVGEKPRAK
jgi:MFS family permease